MSKKMFALAGATALTALMATMATSGCSSSDSTPSDTSDGGTDAKSDAKVIPVKEAGPEEDAAPPPEEATVGKICETTDDCNVADTVNDNVCSEGGFQNGDLFSTSVCIQADCTQPDQPQTVADLLCDGQAGLCLPLGGGPDGICFPLCSFNSTTLTAPCQGNNKCNSAYFTNEPVTSIGYCFGACTADADCTGSAGQKCQVETGSCVNSAAHIVYAKTPGQGCTRPAAGGTQECNCRTVGNFADGGVSADADKGLCTSHCVTGTAGDAACNAKVAGWTCTAKLPATNNAGAALFTGQPADIAGECALPCTVDTDCDALATTAGLTGLVKCQTFAGGKFCEPTAQ